MTATPEYDDELEEIREQAIAVSASLARLAREDPDVFNEYVLRDESTGEPITQAPMHVEWQDLLTHNKYCVLWAHVEGGKTQQIPVGRVLWELGNNPNLRVAIVSKTHGLAVKVAKLVRRYIDHSEELHRVFPALVQGDTEWGESAFTVKRDVFSKDPSVQAFGINGAILGSRVDLLILDDVLQWENTLSPKRMEDLKRHVESDFFGRLTKNGRVWVLGNAYHPDDFMHYLEKKKGWSARRYPVLLPDGSPAWPEAWPLERIEEKRLQVGPLEFQRQMMCIPRDDSTARFKREWIDIALRLGRGRMLADELDHVPNGCRAITGVDLAVQKKAKSDVTALASVLQHPNDNRELLCIESGKWHRPEIVEHIADTNRRYKSIVFVESNGAQDYITQFATQGSAAPVRSFNTGTNKLNPEFGIESIATEFSMGKWIIPSQDADEQGVETHPEIRLLIQEMLFYDPQAHTGDRLMALWIAREGIRSMPAGPPPPIRSGRLDLRR